MKERDSRNQIGDLPFRVKEGFSVYEFIEQLYEANVVERINRFLVKVTFNGKEFLAHLHDPGRLKDLIYPGNLVLIRETKGYKTKFSITAAYSNSRFVVLDSRLHNIIASKFLPEAYEKEIKVGNSRIDFKYDNTYLEVKGCTLVENEIAYFPDAPTERGRTHLKELRELMKKGFNAILLILVMRDDAKCFLPNEKTDPKFSIEFWNSIKEGLNVNIKTFKLVGNKIIYVRDIPLCKTNLT
ncbi:sugar fermentation stimulation protein [Sulfolobus islandicus M.14.25]|uniref:Sugar fermentation stimulation protein homolog n=1 Tax=Saccharolobus islandicus (strain M.14.25 / Kamchatka \|nr:DNA/RNA nuclease SfsA [Sulfolobus islandicus]C3MTF2.1 RecName: Full=Sugar fermentation stimulation protein homolog [Sulfolobus islandicus M.14.25]ACP39445.1 sugar fermentation stimulation protein [Sulfolobus islandicus M.14.25]